MTNTDLQIWLSNTAHQREVADLQAAGLNPILSAHGSGASTPNVMSDSGSSDAVSGAFRLANKAIQTSAKTAEDAVQAVSGLSSPLIQLASASGNTGNSASSVGYWDDLLAPVNSFLDRNRNVRIPGTRITYGEAADTVRAIVNHTSIPGLTSGRSVDSLAQANYEAEVARRSAARQRAAERTRNSNIYRELQNEAATARSLLRR